MDPATVLNAALAGRYTIEREIGRGGMATVYLARDMRHERNVALKVLTANLQHPHILPMCDAGDVNGQAFVCMARYAMRFLLLAAFLLAPSPLAAQVSASGRIEGVIIDSVHMRPLTNAFVFARPLLPASDMGRTAVTDDHGRYHIDSLASNRYAVDFTHPLLDSLGLVLATHVVTLADGKVVRKDFGVPSGRSLRAAACPGVTLGNGQGALVGQVVSADDEAPMAGASVVVRWTDIDLARGLANAFALRSVNTTSSDNGRYRFCGLPTDILLAVQLRSAARAGSVIRMSIADSAGLAVLNLSFSASASYAITANDSVADQGAFLTGTSVLSGTVRGAGGLPVAGAQVRVSDAEPTTRTDTAGHFTLSNLPAGTQRLEVRRLGYLASDHPVSLRNGHTVVLEVQLVRVVSLDSVRIVAQRLKYPEFERRARMGFGRYLRASDIAALGAFDVLSIIVRTPGFRVAGGFSDPRIYTMRSAFGRCEVNVVVDGHEGRDILSVRPEQIAAMEFYTSWAGAPPEYRVECGLILIWTKR